MKLSEWCLLKRGRQAWLVKELGAPQPDVSCWVREKRQVPVGWCLAIERATGGEVTRKELRPSDWMRYWPELAQESAREQAGGVVAEVREAA